MVQPVDVGINKPFKDRMKRKWMEYVLAHPAEQEKFAQPSREELASWIVESIEDMDEGIVQNAWLKTNFSYF